MPSEIDKMLAVARDVQPDLWQRTEEVAKILDPSAFFDNYQICPPEAERHFRIKQQYMKSVSMSKAQEVLRFLGVNTETDWYAILTRLALQHQEATDAE